MGTASVFCDPSVIPIHFISYLHEESFGMYDTDEIT
jgi:hypothetical protein